MTCIQYAQQRGRFGQVLLLCICRPVNPFGIDTECGSKSKCARESSKLNLSNNCTSMSLA